MPDPGTIAALIPAAGSGTRFGSTANKLFALLDGDPLWLHSARRLRQQPAVGRIIMPISPSDRDHFAVQHADDLVRLGIELVDGGAQRSDSVAAGLAAVDDRQTKWVAVHDAARPLVRGEDLVAVFDGVVAGGAAILVTPVPGTIRRGETGSLAHGRTQTVARRHLFVALTPQVFELGLLRMAYDKHNGRPATDDAELVERVGGNVKLVLGAADNLKITYPEDLLVAEAILRGRREG